MQMTTKTQQAAWAVYLHIQVVGVLPHIHGEQRSLAVHQRVLCVGGLCHSQLAILASHEPRPAAAKLGRACGLELLLELVHRSKGLVDCCLQLR